MKKTNNKLRIASGAIVVLNLCAFFSPLRAEMLDTPGGYNLKFIWHQLSWFKRPFNFEFLFILGGVILIGTAFVHMICLVSSKVMLKWIMVFFGLQLASRILVDIYLVSCYKPPFHNDNWRLLAFSGGVSCLISLCLQVAIIINKIKHKTDNVYKS